VINLTAEEFLAEVQKYFPGATIVIKGEGEMTTLTFTVAEVKDPYGNRKTGSIKTSTDQWVSIWPSDKHLFQVGVTYTAVCDAREYNGKTYYTVKSPGKGGDIQQTGGSPTPQASTGPAAPNQPSQTKDDTITRIAIAKSCIEAHESMMAADAWYAWVMREEIPDGATTNAGPDDLNDSIPF
jgi:hypothetical protein